MSYTVVLFLTGTSTMSRKAVLRETFLDDEKSPVAHAAPKIVYDYLKRRRPEDNFTLKEVREFEQRHVLGNQMQPIWYGFLTSQAPRSWRPSAKPYSEMAAFSPTACRQTEVLNSSTSKSFPI